MTQQSTLLRPVDDMAACPAARARTPRYGEWL